MQRESGVGVVGIGIPPRTVHRGVVDRQQLDDPLSGGDGPVRHLLQVAELADAEARPGAQRKDRDGRPGTAQPAFGKAGQRRRIEHMVTVARHLRPNAVSALLPHPRRERPPVGDQKFVFESAVRTQRDAPLGKAAVVHRHRAPPAAQLLAASGHGQHLVRQQRRADAAQRDVSVRSRAFRSGPPPEHAPREGERPQRPILRHVVPPVQHRERTVGEPLRQPQPMGQPLSAQASAALRHDLVAVFCRELPVPGVDLGLPDAVGRIVHGMAPSAPAEHEIFAPAGAVFDSEDQFHGSGCSA